MCVRYSCTLNAEEIETTLHVPAINTEKQNPRTNVAPRTYNPVVHNHENQLTLDYLEWGLNPAAKLSTFNCRVESLEELRPTWKCAKSQRAVAIMNGYYEWQHKALDRIPYFIHTKEKLAMALAIWDKGCYSIVTKPASTDLGKIHPRMPILVDYEVAKKWINGEWPEVLKLVGDGIEPEFHRVSQKVNKVGNQDLNLMKQVKSMDLGSWAGVSPKKRKLEDTEPKREQEERAKDEERADNSPKKEKLV